MDNHIISTIPINIYYLENNINKKITFHWLNIDFGNSYYNNEFEWKYYNTIPIKQTTSHVVFIIGLPGSGKTHLARKYTNKKYVVFDDLELIQGDTLQKIFVLLQKGKNICIVHQRFLIYREFMTFINLLFAEPKNVNIEIILFKNDPERAINNLRRLQEQYMKSSSKIKEIEQKINSVNDIVEYYDETKYTHYKHKLVNIYKPRSTTINKITKKKKIY